MLSLEEGYQVAEAIEARQSRFQDEPLRESILVVLFNFGDRYIQVKCVAGEWEGIKADIPRREGGGIPLCPNGHVMTEHGGGKELSLVDKANPILEVTHGS